METTIIGISQNIRRIKKLIDQVADTGMNIIVCGETGVGKEVVVQNLYLKSNRADKPFVKVNCASLPETLLESEMFGYEKGAFTGAARRMRGKFEQANEGILFLDEIGEMDLSLQSKLLHVLEGGDFTPLGSEKSVQTNAWVVCATNHELENDVKNGKFREDLYYRLSAIKIYIEPLRNRPEDIPYLIDHFLKIYGFQLNGKQMKSPSKRTIDKLMAYHWPGNVRELQNALKRIILLGDRNEVMDELFRKGGRKDRSLSAITSGKIPSLPFDLIGLQNEDLSNLSSLNLKDIKEKAADRLEKELISFVLEKTEWNRTKASKILDISYKTLLFKIQDLNIIPPIQT